MPDPMRHPEGADRLAAAADRDVILVVDDDPEVTAMLREFLEGQGYAVLVAHTCAEGRRLLQPGPVSLVLLDLHLPDGEGTDVLWAAMRIEKPPDVVIVTGHATLDSAIAAVEAGAAGYVRKPFDFARLAAHVRKVFERRQLADENARLRDTLAQRLAETEALLAIASTISSTLELQEALRRICRELARLVGADTASVHLLDRESDLLVPYAAYHVPREYLAALASISLPLREQRFHLALWTHRRPVCSDHIGDDDRFNHEAFRRFPHQSGLLLPLLLDGEVAGAFYLVWWTARRSFTDQELAQLQGICGQIALFLRNARLYEQAERDRRRLEALNDVSRRLAQIHDTEQILSVIVEEASRLLIAEAAGIRLLDGEDLVLVAVTETGKSLLSHRRLKVGETLAGRVVTSGAPIAVEDLAEDPGYDPGHVRIALKAGFHGLLLVPLRAHGRTIGALSVYTTSRRRFLADEISLASAFADQASLAIEKGRLLREADQGRQEAERRRYEAEVLAELTRDINASLDLDSILHGVAERAKKLCHSDQAVIALRDAASAAMVFRYWAGARYERFAELRIEPGKGSGGQVLLTGRPFRTDNYADDPRITKDYLASVQANQVVAQLVVPIRLDTRVEGLLYAENWSPRPFTEHDEVILQRLADQVATAIKNARLFEEAENRQIRLEQVFASTSDGILVLDLDGRITALNRPGAELLGIAADEVVGCPLAGLVERLRETGAETASFGELGNSGARPGSGDLGVRVPDARTLHWRASPTEDLLGVTVGLTVTFQDVTQEREVGRMKSDFVSFVTHQLRTPLAGIKWMLELASQDGDNPDDMRSCIQDARAAAERLIGLVNDLLDISRLESGKLSMALQEMSLGAVTRSVVDELAPLINEKRHRLTVEEARGAASVVVDPQLVRQVILNLVSNAIKYTPGNGEIGVRIDRDGDRVRWAIRDSGIGIPRAAQSRLFEKFYRADNAVSLETEGTGLGLYLVRLIVERFGGRIWCESEEGAGSTFAFTLPTRGGGP